MMKKKGFLETQITQNTQKSFDRIESFELFESRKQLIF